MSPTHPAEGGGQQSDIDATQGGMRIPRPGLGGYQGQIRRGPHGMAEALTLRQPPPLLYMQSVGCCAARAGQTRVTSIRRLVGGSSFLSQSGVVQQPGSPLSDELRLAGAGIELTRYSRS
jgi:hypothetical protein